MSIDFKQEGIKKVIITVVVIISVLNLILNYDLNISVIESLGFYKQLLMFLVGLKIVGVIGMWFSKNNFVVKLMYASFFFDFLLMRHFLII